jgi:hypothetical protein
VKRQGQSPVTGKLSIAVLPALLVAVTITILERARAVGHWQESRSWR